MKYLHKFIKSLFMVLSGVGLITIVPLTCSFILWKPELIKACLILFIQPVSLRVILLITLVITIWGDD